jgi:beta-carotene 3-hydroxylase
VHRFRSLVVGVAAFAVMEPVTYATHRFVMHGLGQVLHRSHHRARARFVEANDAYPAVFASAVLVTMWGAYHRQGLRGLLPVTVGVSAYGVTYALVHDGYIHGRLPATPPNRVLDHLAESHRIHHLYNGEPYGMLVPVVSTGLRARAARTDRDPLRRRVANAA